MKKFILLFTLLPAMCAAQSTSGFHRVAQVITRGNSGVTAQIVPSARVFVQNTNTGVAAVIYSDPLLTLTIPGAIVTSDANGNYGYYAPLNTCLTENISSPSQGSLIIPNICGNSGLSLPLGTLNGGTGTTTAPTTGQILVGQTGSTYLPKTAIGDCSLASTGSFTCLKTNGVSFTAAATTPLGTSGDTLCLLSSSCVWSQNLFIANSTTSGPLLEIGSLSVPKRWYFQVEGSAGSSPGNLDIVDVTDSTTPVISLSHTTATLFGSPICTAANAECSSGSGSVTNFIAPSGSWPTWLVPTVTNSTTTPSLAVSASAIPNSALASPTITINSVSCTLGSTCTVSGTARSCNANGCYIIMSDGTILQWGHAAGCGGGVFTCGTAVVFPFPFTTTANMSITTTQYSGGANWFTTVQSPTTTGFGVAYAAVVFVGGSGVNLDGTETANWMAIGH